MARAMTTSNFLRLASLSMASNAGRLSRPLAPVYHIPATALRDLLKAVALIVDRLALLVCADPDVDCRALAHETP